MVGGNGVKKIFSRQSAPAEDENHRVESRREIGHRFHDVPGVFPPIHAGVQVTWLINGIFDTNKFHYRGIHVQVSAKYLDPFSQKSHNSLKWQREVDR